MQVNGEANSRSVVSVVHSAWDKLLMGELDEALELLRSVESETGKYSTFHVVLAGVLLAKNDYVHARHAAQRALALAPTSAHAKLIAEIAQEKIQSGGKEPVKSDATEPVALGEIPSPVPPRRTLASLLDPEEPQAATGPQFDIDRTADELTRERPLVRPIPEPEHIQSVVLPEPEDAPALVSETLAEIMIRQGKLNDAKKVYIQLARQQPERYPHFKTKIEAIDKLLLGTSIAPETTDNDPVA